MRSEKQEEKHGERRRKRTRDVGKDEGGEEEWEEKREKRDAGRMEQKGVRKRMNGQWEANARTQSPEHQV